MELYVIEWIYDNMSCLSIVDEDKLVGLLIRRIHEANVRKLVDIGSFNVFLYNRFENDSLGQKLTIGQLEKILTDSYYRKDFRMLDIYIIKIHNKKYIKFGSEDFVKFINKKKSGTFRDFFNSVGVDIYLTKLNQDDYYHRLRLNTNQLLKIVDDYYNPLASIAVAHTFPRKKGHGAPIKNVPLHVLRLLQDFQEEL
jgi:hypothetical protein